MRFLLVALLWMCATIAVAQPHAAGYVRPHSEVEANKPATDMTVESGAFEADWDNLAALEAAP